jgi:hypothetical protein
MSELNKNCGIQHGPCIVCGDIDYPLSYGGSKICPPCDCGIDPELTKARIEIKKLKETLEKRDRIIEKLSEALRDISIHNERPFMGEKWHNYSKMVADEVLSELEKEAGEKKCEHKNTWFDRTISLRRNGEMAMADICVDCGIEAGQDKPEEKE